MCAAQLMLFTTLSHHTSIRLTSPAVIRHYADMPPVFLSAAMFFEMREDVTIEFRA